MQNTVSVKQKFESFSRFKHHIFKREPLRFPSSIDFFQSFYEKGRGFTFILDDLKPVESGKYVIKGRYVTPKHSKESLYPKKSVLSFPAVGLDDILEMVGAIQMPASYRAVHGWSLYEGEVSENEQRYLNFFEDTGRIKELESNIKAYLDQFPSFEDNWYPEIVKDGGWGFRSIAINNNNNMKHSRISIYVTGNGTIDQPEDLTGLIMTIYPDLYDHKTHEDMFREKMSYHYKGEFIMPVGGSYLTVIEGNERDQELKPYRSIYAVTGERSDFQGPVFEPLREPLLLLIEQEVEKMMCDREIKIVTGFPD